MPPNVEGMDRFIVGTGRCGSTLLSQMMAQHDHTLSIFEFFTGLDITRRFAKEPIDGAAFAALISRENPIVTMVVRRGYQVPEITYPFDTPARATGATTACPGSSCPRCRT